MKARHLLRAMAILMASALLFPDAAFGQMFRLGKLEGDLTVEGDLTHQEITSTDSEPSISNDLLLQQRLSLRAVEGYVLHPKFIRFSLGGRFGFSQYLQQDMDSSILGRLWGYNAFVSVLPTKRVSLNLFATRSQSYVSRQLIGRSLVTLENQGFILFLPRIPLPSTLSYRREYQSQELVSGTYTPPSNETRHSINYEGQRGWFDSEMSLRYEFVYFSNDIDALSYQSHEGNLYYSVDLGTELNWRWNTQVHAFNRFPQFSDVGSQVLSTVGLDELVHAEHSESLGSEYRYNVSMTKNGDDTTTTHSGSMGLQHQLYQNVTTTLNGNGVLQKLPGGEKKSGRGLLNVIYSKRLPLKGLLSAAVGGGIQYDNDDFSSSSTPISQESHTAESPLANPIKLDNLNVVQSTIVVWKTAISTANLPPGCVVPREEELPIKLVLNQDYSVETVNKYTQLVPKTCDGTTKGINPGDTIAVDYSFYGETRTYSTTTFHANLSVDYGWFHVDVGHESANQLVLSGRDDGFTDDQSSDHVAGELRWKHDWLHTTLGGEARRAISSYMRSNGFRALQSIDMQLSPGLSLTLNADQSVMSFENPKRESRTFSGRAGMTYSNGSNLLLEGFARAWWLSDTTDVQTSEQSLEGSLRLRWSFRQLEVNSSVTYANRRRGEAGPKEFRATLQIVRLLF